MTINTELRIKLIDKFNVFVCLLSQIEAFNLLRHGFCKLCMDNHPTVQFHDRIEQWDDRLKSARFSGGKTIKTVVYGNIHIQSPDGKDMFRCDNKKALWYLNRSLVEVVCENPPTLRLLFRPNGMGHTGDKYHLANKANCCVVCGVTKKLNRHHVMPYVFRRHLDEKMKGHDNHDVLLTCINCHDAYEKEAVKLKKAICEEYSVDFQNKNTHLIMKDKLNAVKAAKALLLFYDKIPEHRTQFLMNQVRLHLQKDEITKEDLSILSKESYFIEDDERRANYGRDIMRQVKDVQSFVSRWRRHFVDTMQPKFLPDYWDVSKPIKISESKTDLNSLIV